MNIEEYKETYKDGKQSRRTFLEKFGVCAAFVPPLIYMLMSPKTSNANSQSKGSGGIKDQEFYDEILKTANERIRSGYT